MMNQNNTAIQYIEALKQIAFPNENVWQLDLAIIALDKQIPKKPSKDKCPTCFTEVKYIQDYCSGCGQKIDWEE